MLSHQDWNVVVLNPKKQAKTGGPVQNQSNEVNGALAKKNTHNHGTFNKDISQSKLEQRIEANGVKRVASKDAQEIIKARVAKKWTQKQLAMATNMDEKTINEIESCKAVENKSAIALLRRALGIVGRH